jgi:hypothetical protein
MQFRVVDTLSVLCGNRMWKRSGEITAQDEGIFMLVKLGNNSVALIYFGVIKRCHRKKVLWTVGMMALSLLDIVCPNSSPIIAGPECL